jgi:hypothetical protein
MLELFRLLSRQFRSANQRLQAVKILNIFVEEEAMNEIYCCIVLLVG